MAGLNFDGGSTNTSIVKSTGNNAIGSNAFSFIAAIKPNSTGQGGVGTIMQSSTTNPTSRKRLSLYSASGSNLDLEFFASRATTATSYKAAAGNSIQTGSSALPVIVAVSFDQAATPTTHIYVSASGGSNDVDVVEVTYDTAIDGSGTTQGSDTELTVGNDNGGGRTFDGDILWASFTRNVVTIPDLNGMRAGFMPTAFLNSAGTQVKTPWLGAGFNGTDTIDIATNATVWTNTNTTSSSSFVWPYGGESFASGSGRYVMPHSFPASQYQMII